MLEKYSVWSLIIIVGVSAYLLIERNQIKKEVNRIDQMKSIDAKNSCFLRLLVQLTSAVFVCLTFIFTLLAIALYNGGLFE